MARLKNIGVSLNFAKRMIREKIDGEQKFIPTANYEMSGNQLQEYLAFAYREGMKNSPIALVSDSPTGNPVARQGQSPGKGKKQKQGNHPGDTRLAGSPARVLRRLHDAGEDFDKRIDKLTH